MLNISGIEEGYVIDHIRAGSCMKIYDALNLDKCEGEVAIIKNAKSGKLGKKDIIKIEGLGSGAAGLSGRQHHRGHYQKQQDHRKEKLIAAG